MGYSDVKFPEGSLFLVTGGAGFIGFETIDGRFNLPNGINEYMIEVLTDLTNDINVGKIYKKSDREKYLDEIRERKKQCSGIPGSIQQQHKHTEEFGSIPLPADPVDVDKTKVKEISPNSSDKEEKQKKSYPIHRIQTMKFLLIFQRIGVGVD